MALTDVSSVVPGLIRLRRSHFSRSCDAGGTDPLPVPAFANLRRARVSPTRSCGSEHRPSASHSEETPANIGKQQPVTRKARVSCEVNGIGATGVRSLLVMRPSVCIGTKIVQPAQNDSMIGSDYAGLSNSLPWPYQILTIIDNQCKRKKWRIPW
jgi:hypothetical protein